MHRVAEPGQVQVVSFVNKVSGLFNNIHIVKYHVDGVSFLLKHGNKEIIAGTYAVGVCC